MGGCWVRPNISKPRIADPTTRRSVSVLKDEIWIYANNTGGSDLLLTIEFGGVTSPDDLIIVNVQKEMGLLLVIPGIVQSNTQIIRAFAAGANDINITGFVNRIAP